MGLEIYAKRVDSSASAKKITGRPENVRAQVHRQIKNVNVAGGVICLSPSIGMVINAKYEDSFGLFHHRYMSGLSLIHI